MIDRTHDPDRRSWVESANQPGCDFPIQNLPFATFRRAGDRRPLPGAAIGDRMLDLTVFGIEALSGILSMPRARRVELRARIGDFLERHTPDAEFHLTPIAHCEFELPCAIGDYTDFYASANHARNVGSLFRPDNPLLPNYKWVPIAYHGRASSIVLSGTPVRRPCGQISPAAGAPPIYAPTRKLDYELELGAFLGPETELGEPVPIGRAPEHLAGVCLLNDWSARDIQAWEYQPLGPFLAKNFATSISPFLVTAEALEPFRGDPNARPEGDPPPLPYLAGGSAFDIQLEVWLRTPGMSEPVRVSRGNFRSMYWTLDQMIAHHTSNGCNLRPGDLIGSGTVSGPEPESRGCLLELTRGGAEPLALPNGETRRFLEDGDEVILRGWCEAPGFRRVGLGECRGVVLPAIHSE
jgi:fumarylacetoacetase